MLIRNRIAALFTSIGLVGLAISTFLSPTSASATSAKTISIAISSGSNLHLSAVDQHVRANVALPKTGQHLICRNVYRLSIADLGITCSPATSAVALASN